MEENIRPLANYKTDRIYLAAKSGALTCLRELTSLNPVFHGGDLIEIAEDKPADPAGDAEAAEASPQMIQSDNPFATGAVPAAEKPASDNPFATDNPFAKDEKKDKKEGGDSDNPFDNNKSDEKKDDKSKDDGNPFG